MQHSFSFLLALLMTSLSFAQTQKQLLTPELLWKVGRVMLEAVSPNSQYAVYSVQRFDVDKNQSSKVLYIVHLQTLETRPLTDAAEGNASDAVFHPSGQRIGFLRNRKLWEVGLSGGKAIQVTDFDIEGFAYSPTGRHLLFVQRVKFEPTPTDRYPDLPKATGRIYDSLFYRHWQSWYDHHHANIFYVPYRDGRVFGSPVNIMNEPYDSPLRPLGGMEQITWSPDGRFIVYTCRKLKGTEESLSTNSDLYLYELASGRTVNITEGLPGYDQDPIFSPDGRYLAWKSMEKAGYEADRTRILVLDTRTNDRWELTEGWKYEANRPQWAADSKSLYFLSSNDFTYQIHQITLEGRKIRRITEGLHDYTKILVAGDRLVASRVSMTSPPEIFLVNPQNGQALQISQATADVWSHILPARVERRNVKTTDGKNMNVWLVLPPDFDPRKKYPALLYCQGGPQSALSQSFSFRWNMQLMASQGYVVVAPCRRGMPGGPEGQDWNAAISGDWGGQAMRDLLSAADAAAREPFVDAQRMGAVGASFGGYSVFWLAGNHQKRFKAFIAHCGMFNTVSWYGTTEELFFANHDLGGPYWEKPNDPAWAAFSPHTYVRNWDTPILIFHNELDFRVPLSEGLQAFQAAQLMGVPSRLVVFPDEGHWMTKPQNSIMWQREFFGWLDKYLKP